MFISVTDKETKNSIVLNPNIIGAIYVNARNNDTIISTTLKTFFYVSESPGEILEKIKEVNKEIESKYSVEHGEGEIDCFDCAKCDKC